MDIGFGLLPVPEDPTILPCDHEAAVILKAAVDTIPPRITGATQSRPSSWPAHFRLLRTRDGVQPKDILAVVRWYADNIGQPFVPIAYSGEAFRRKFHAIERQCARDTVHTLEISPQAATIARRLTTLGWPVGSAENLPGAAQATLNAYSAWVVRRVAFTEQLRRDDLTVDYGAERQRLLRFAEYLARTMPSPGHFTQEWLTAAHSRVKGWPGWSGEFTPFVFKPEIKRFRTMGRGWAEAYAQDPNRWDRFVEVMNEEDV